MCKAKANGHYMNSMLALQEAVIDGYDEAMLLDVDGFVAEGSGENIFIVQRQCHLYPDLTSALEGITRDTIVQLAAEKATSCVKSASPATRSISPMKPSSPVRPPR